MAKITLPTILNGSSTTQVNANFQAIATELNDKALYRDNPVGEPNAMQNDIDMNSNDVLNAKQIQAESLKVNGTLITATDPLGTVPASGVTYNNASSGLTADDAQDAIDEVEARVDTAETNITTLQSDVTTAQADITALEADSMGTLTVSEAISGGPGTTPAFATVTADLERGITTNTTGNAGFTITKAGLYRIDLDFALIYNNTLASYEIAKIFINSVSVKDYLNLWAHTTAVGTKERAGSTRKILNLAVGDIINFTAINDTHSLTATAELSVVRIGDTV